ncbi:hypothetical protein Tco_0374189 [Tanacetum coccineum]
MLLAMKDEARGNLNDVENDFMIDNTYGDNTLEELSTAVIVMARIQPTNDKSDAEPKYNAEVLSELKSQSIQKIDMLWKKTKQVYDPNMKIGLGYQNPERLKKAIAAQPKMYDGEQLASTKLKVDLPDSEETLEDVEESRLKMKDKMIQLDYEKLNALYDSFVPQTGFLVE